ncbi:MAG: TRAP transporter large permease subunit, partial [Hyphomicrobium sp.]|nr:TRAP transporter large permease subunit [Hyphomicrobium sp.]
MNWKFLKDAIIEGGSQTAVVMFLVAASALIGVFLTEAKVPQEIATAIVKRVDSPWVVLAILNVFFFVVGLFLHSAAAIILVVPIVMPLVIQYGIDPIHFGMVVTLNLGLGQQTPPVASVLMTACSVAKADIWEVTKANIPFIGVLLFVLILVTYVPIVAMLPVEFFYR